MFSAIRCVIENTIYRRHTESRRNGYEECIRIAAGVVVVVAVIIIIDESVETAFT